jgi:hypothetical protein
VVKQITVHLPDSLYQRTRQFAERHQQEMGDAISALIEEGLAAQNSEDKMLDWTQPDPAVDREMEAYIAMHPTLKQKYFGKHVAIYHGELIDMDDDMAALFARIDAKYPDEFVWLTQVGPEAIETIAVRSPRLLRD